MVQQEGVGWNRSEGFVAQLDLVWLEFRERDEREREREREGKGGNTNDL